MDATVRIERIWRWYKRRPSTILRDALVEHYVDLLPREAKKLRTRLPAQVELDDLMADGALGLLDAIDKFIPGKASFKTFSKPRIRGAMIDGLRARDTISRSNRRSIKKLEDAAEFLRVTSGSNPTPHEIAGRLGVDVKSVTHKERITRQSVTRSLAGHRIRSNENDHELSADQISDPRQEDPARTLLRQNLREIIMTGFSRAERLIVILYYYEGMTMREIGQTLELSESRICQMHTSIIARLRGRLEESQLRVG